MKTCPSRASYAAKLRLAPSPPAVSDARWIALGRGLFVLVDEDLFEELDQFIWSCGDGYARRQVSRVTKEIVFLHHVVLGRKTQTDHINGNPLDCRRQNLRPVSRAQNNMNGRKQEGRTSKYKGVSFDPTRKCWAMQIQKNRKHVARGRFSSEVEAAEAYDTAARLHFGEFARLNFPEPGEQSALKEVTDESLSHQAPAADG